MTTAGIPHPPSYSCSGSDCAALDAQTPAPISSGQFAVPSTTMWTGAGSGHFQGTFDSATTAHGTADFERYISGPGCYSGLATTADVPVDGNLAALSSGRVPSAHAPWSAWAV